jgi:hypothetical protein
MDRSSAPLDREVIARAPLRGLLALAGFLAGCSQEAQVLSDYTLTLEPRVPANQEGLFEGQSVSLVFRGEGETTIEWIDDLTGDRVSRADFGPLEGETIGVLVEEPGGQATAIDSDLLLAYGETGPFTLATGAQTATAPFLLAAYGGVGDLDVFPDEEAGMRAALAMEPDGTGWMFGGAYQFNGSNNGHAYVQKLEPLDTGEWVFDVVGEMPDFDGSGEPDPMVAGMATYVESNGRPYILVTGGRPEAFPYNDNSYHAALWDPEEEEWVWEDEFGMNGSRAHHRAITMQNGNVLLVGGMAGDGTLGSATLEIFDVDEKAFDIAAGSMLTPAIGFAVADLGPKGVLVCGGGALSGTSTNQYTAPSDLCYVVDAAGEATATEPLPRAVQALAMAPLGDGRVLACGGIAEDAYFTEPTDAIPDAWIYDPASQTWTTLTSRLGTARALHEAIPMPDGKVLIVGGVERGVLLDGNVEGPVACNEIFEPDTFTFTVAEPCSNAGSGAEPTVAWHPDHGAIVVEGYGEDQRGGQSYGVIGFPPNL